MQTTSKTSKTTVTAALMSVAAVATIAQAAPRENLNVRWNNDNTGLSFSFQGRNFDYPNAVMDGAFPAPGRGMDLKVTNDWPVVAVRARWSVSTAGWTSEDRAAALDFLVLRAADADRYQRMYPDAVKSARVTSRPKLNADPNDPAPQAVVEALRGNRMFYTLTGDGGFGAADYDLDTEVRFGLSGDGKTAFYHDRANRISDHLSNREYLVVAHDAGDRVLVEVVALNTCRPAGLLKGVVRGRVESSARYLTKQMFAALNNAPSAREEAQRRAMLEQVTQDVRMAMATNNSGSHEQS